MSIDADAVMAVGIFFEVIPCSSAPLRALCALRG